MQSLSGTIIKGYELREQIGAGGFGAVYRAYQAVINREVAMKIILPQHANQPEFIRNFEGEAQLIARLEHPYIVPLFDFWRDPDGAFLVMRWLRGGSLAKRLKEGGALPIEKAVEMVEQIAGALAVAHRNNVVHRDLKPDNILLDEDENAYLTDFGIAKLVGGGATDHNISGSLRYIAPEQLRAQPASVSADIYSLGLMVFEMLTGHYPFGEATVTEIVMKHLEDPIPDIHDFLPDVPYQVGEVLNKATSKRPEERYSDARQFAAELRQAIQQTGQVLEVLDWTQIDPVTIVNPYKGLRAFQEADAADFFGREALTERLLARLREDVPESRFLSVVGPSGSGKSSAVRAGVVPALRRGALRGSDKWFIVDMLPGTQPLRNLEAALLSVALKPPSRLYEMLKADEGGLSWAVDRILSDVDGDLLLLIDQFEEVFTNVSDEAERVHFLNLLRTAVMAEDSRLHIIITLRADFTDRPLEYVDFGELMRLRTEFVLPLSAQEIERAITGPAHRVGLLVDTELVAAIVSDVREEPGALPLLQYALTEVFERREGVALTLEAYQSSGGVLGALARRAEEVYSAAPPEHQRIIRQMFLRLVTLGEGTEDTRRRARRSEIADVVQDNDALQAVLSAFGQFRLLTFDYESGTREPTLEVAHEALIREWKRLREWLDLSRADVRLQRVLAGEANEWQKSGRDSSFLLSGARLAQYEEWQTSTDLALTPLERAYISASAEERARRDAAEVERKRREEATAQRAEQFAKRASQLRRAAILLGVVVAGAVVATFILIAQVSNTQTEVAAGQTQIAQVQPTLEGAQAQIALANTQIAGVEPTLQQAQGEIALANTQIAGVQPTLQAGETQIAGVQPTLDAASVQIQEAQAQVAAVQPTLVAGETQIAGVQPTLDAANVQVQQAQAQVTAFQPTVQAAQARIDAIVPTLNAANTQVAGVEPTLGAANLQVQQAQAQVAAVQPTVEAAQARIAAIVPTLDAANTQVAGVRPTLDAANQRVDDAQAQVAAVQPTVTAAQLQLGLAQTQIAGVQPTLQAGETQIAGVQPTLDAANLQVQEAQAQVAAVQPTVEAAQAQIDAIVPTLAFAETRVAGVEPTLNAANTQVAGVAPTLNAANLQVQEAQAQVAAVQPTVEAAQAQIDAIVPTLAFAETRVAGVEPTLAAANTQVAGVAPTLAQAETQIAGVVPTLESVQKEVQSQRNIADALRLVRSAQQLLETGNPDLAIALVLEAYRLNNALGETQRILNGAIPLTVRLNLLSQAADMAGTSRSFVTATSDRDEPLFEPDRFMEVDVNGFQVFSPDERFLALARFASVEIWSPATRQLLYQLPAGAPISAMVFSLDGQTLVAGTATGGLVVWDAGTGIERHRLQAHQGAILALAYHPLTTQVIVGSDDRSSSLWDVSEGRQIASLSGHSSPVLRVAFNENGSEAYSYDFDATAPRVGVYRVGVAPFFRNPPIYRNVSPRNNIATVGGDGRRFLTLFDADTGVEQRTFRLGTESEDYIRQIAFSNDNRSVLVHVETRDYLPDQTYVVIDRYIELWDIVTGGLVRRFESPTQDPTAWDVYSLSFSSDDQLAIVGGRFSKTYSASVYNVNTGGVVRRFTGHTTPVVRVAFSQARSYALSVSSDGNVRVWDIGSIQQNIAQQIRPNFGSLTSFGVSADGTQLVMAYNGQSIIRWDVIGNSPINASRFFTATQLQVEFNPSLPQALVRSADGMVLWDLNTSTQYHRFLNVNNNLVTAVAFSPNGQQLWYAEAGKLFMWDVATRTATQILPATPEDLAPYNASFIAPSPNGEFVAFVIGTRIVIYDLILRQPAHTMNYTGGVINSLSYSPDGGRLLTAIGEPDNTVLLWDASTGNLIYTLVGHRADALTAVFSPDSTVALSGGLDNRIILWDLASGQIIREYEGHTAAVRQVRFSPAGGIAYSLSDNVQDGIIAWSVQSVRDTVNYVYNNRYVPEIDCQQRQQYGVSPQCAEDGRLPTAQPTPTSQATPTSTPTATPRPTLTPTPTPMPIGILQGQGGSNINVRAEAGPGFALVTQATSGTQVFILEERRDIGWSKILLPDGLQGWVLSGVIARQN